MAKFRSTDSPNVILEFSEEHDIQAMRQHSQYEEITEQEPEVKPTKPVKTK
jgi:hypothetical protein